MEPVGLAVGVAGLAGVLSTCLDVIERVDIYKDFDKDSRSLAVQFEAEKVRLKKWACDVGYQEGKLSDNHHAALDDPQIRLMTTELLSVIKGICGGATATIQKHPLDSQPGLGGDTAIPTNGNQFLSKHSESRRQKLVWSLRGKARRTSQVENLGVLVQHLHNLVSPDSVLPQGELLDRPDEACVYGKNDYMERRTLLHEIRQTLSRLEKEMEAETRRDLRAWLACPPPNDLYFESKQKRLEKTCDWILERPEFIEWLAPDAKSTNTEKLLWINGPAGLGKTVLCARVVEYLMSLSQTPVAYFFLSSDFESRDNPYAAIRSWVHQVTSCRQVAYQLVRDKWLAQNEQFATQTEIVNLFREVAQAIHGATFVLDGLDECTWIGEGHQDNKSLRNFLDTMMKAVSNTHSRLLVVSRDESEIRSGMLDLKRCGELKIVSEDVQSDVARYSRSIVDKKLPKKDSATREDVSQMLADRSTGQFLWVKLHEESLRSWKNKKQLVDAINEIPPGLDHVYERNWTRISRLPDPIRNRAYSLLQWAAFALRPLTINEISEAVLIDEGREEFPAYELPDEVDDDFIDSEIQSPCGSLLEIRGTPSDVEIGLRTVHLTHFSVKQYFLSNISAQWLPFRLNGQISNEILQSSRLAKLCLRYINSRHFSDSEMETTNLKPGSTQEESMKACVKRSFRYYAADSWYQHAAAGDEHDANLAMFMNALFDVLNPSWSVWRNFFEINSPDIGLGTDFQLQPQHAGPLHYAAQFGFVKLASYLIHNKQHDVDAKAPFGRTALEIACRAGDFRLSKMLPDAGANSSASNDMGSTPLMEATYQGAFNLIKLLLDNGADYNAADNRNDTALIVASSRGHLEIVTLLLEKGCEVAFAIDYGCTSLRMHLIMDT
ncbi:hypothetical protein CORC01_11542 [Colletotrichum orchidophilum]|uniref:Uncharacterized protein n=1 Tax=Colletotrichum orchidophilum TaxID=1209926 RepID=A0A1G4AVC8_9PEZI|nr:uncharacterized protein CORC01_11542 [Colletotrichum orchidophilum]OHE93130.1 hypothetical protein CORC01_11542 [Colletotrichum orchidophilum]